MTAPVREDTAQRRSLPVWQAVGLFGASWPDHGSEEEPEVGGG